jgi:hypothetical protein
VGTTTTVVGIDAEGLVGNISLREAVATVHSLLLLRTG